MNQPDASMILYLTPTAFLDIRTKSLFEKAQEIVNGKDDLIEKAISLFYFVRDEIRYNLFVYRSRREHFIASRILDKGEGYCVQKAVLLAAMGRAVDIPTRLGFARIKNYQMSEYLRKQLGSDVLPFHGYTEFFLDNNWIKATPALNISLCDRNGFVPVDFNGKHDAMFPPKTSNGELHIEYIADLGHYADLPITKVWAALVDAYGSRSLKKLPK